MSSQSIMGPLMEPQRAKNLLCPIYAGTSVKNCPAEIGIYNKKCVQQHGTSYHPPLFLEPVFLFKLEVLYCYYYLLLSLLIAFVWNCAIQINHCLFHEFIIIYMFYPKEQNTYFSLLKNILPEPVIDVKKENHIRGDLSSMISWHNIVN